MYHYSAKHLYYLWYHTSIYKGALKSLFGTLGETGSNADAHQNTLPLAIRFLYKMSRAQLPFPILMWVIISMIKHPNLTLYLLIITHQPKGLSK